MSAAVVGRPRVVVVGSGFGGLFATRALRRSDVDVTMVARTSHHLFQPLLYQVATGILSEGEVAPSVRAVLSRQANARFLLGDVTAVDLAARTVVSVHAGRTTLLEYDELVVAAGAGPSYFGNDALAEHAPAMKSVDDALDLRGRILGAFERAELAAVRGEDPTTDLTFVVVGAGPTGVELAGQVAELAGRALRRDFRSIDPGEARVVVVDGAERVLPALDERSSREAERALRRRGVEVLLGTTVSGVDAVGVDLVDGAGRSSRVPASTTIWAAGVAASPLARGLAEQSGAAVDRAGRVHVEPDLTLPGHPEVHVVGDMAHLDDLPGVAQVAIQGGRYAARAIDRRRRGRPAPPPFRYRDKGSMAIIGRFRAVGKVAGVPVRGLVAWLIWLGLHLAYVTGFRNRLTAVVHWAVAFLGRGPSERTTTERQVRAPTRRPRRADAPAMDAARGADAAELGLPGVFRLAHLVALRAVRVAADAGPAEVLAAETRFVELLDREDVGDEGPARWRDLGWLLHDLEDWDLVELHRSVATPASPGPPGVEQHVAAISLTDRGAEVVSVLGAT
jgi:NADH dehydrogenase